MRLARFSRGGAEREADPKKSGPKETRDLG
jgi:hypothetical protein